MSALKKVHTVRPRPNIKSCLYSEMWKISVQAMLHGTRNIQDTRKGFQADLSQTLPIYTSKGYHHSGS